MLTGADDGGLEEASGGVAKTGRIDVVELEEDTSGGVAMTGRTDAAGLEGVRVLKKPLAGGRDAGVCADDEDIWTGRAALVGETKADMMELSLDRLEDSDDRELAGRGVMDGEATATLIIDTLTTELDSPTLLVTVMGIETVVSGGVVEACMLAGAGGAAACPGADVMAALHLPTMVVTSPLPRFCSAVQTMSLAMSTRPLAMRPASPTTLPIRGATSGTS